MVAKVKDGNEGGAAGRRPQRIKKTAPEPGFVQCFGCFFTGGGISLFGAR